MKFVKHLLLVALVSLFSCTDLEESLQDTLTKEQATELVSVEALINSSYAGLRNPFMDQSRFWAAQQHTSDETLGPTRGPDWDDNGIWRVLHDHTWTPEHAFLAATFDELLQVVFSTTNALDFKPTVAQNAEARYLRAFVMFCIADGWNQVPFRQPGENLLNAPQVLRGPAALDFVIAELNEILPNLPDGPTNRANKDAARVLLMKAYLNKGTFNDRKNPSFPSGDMDKVIEIADQIIASGKYQLEDNYFDNFAPNNDVVSSENIWTGENKGGISSGNVRSRWFCTLHYNQNPSGWNGFATLSDFYDSFEENDVRRSASYTGMTDVSSIKAGLLVGQQFNRKDTVINNRDSFVLVPLKDRKGNDLAFTREVKLVETGDNLEITGIRVVKYPIDYTSGDNSNNDYVFFRYADVLQGQL